MTKNGRILLKQRDTGKFADMLSNGKKYEPKLDFINQIPTHTN